MRTEGVDWKEHKEKTDECIRQFKEGEITEVQFKTYLFDLGFRGQDIEAEVSLCKQEMEDKS